MLHCLYSIDIATKTIATMKLFALAILAAAPTATAFQIRTVQHRSSTALDMSSFHTTTDVSELGEDRRPEDILKALGTMEGPSICYGHFAVLENKRELDIKEYDNFDAFKAAIDQAECVAGNICGQETRYDPKPWFWSDQYDTKLQIAGLNTGYDRVIVRPGEQEGAVSHWYYHGDDLLAVDSMNDPRAYMVGKRLIEGGHSPEAAEIGDPSTDLKALLKR